MNEPGVIHDRAEGKVTLRIRSLEPYSAEFTAEQLGILADVAESYGSGSVHVTPRQTIEIPDISEKKVPAIQQALAGSGLALGSAGLWTRNVTACSRWCLFNAAPMSSLAQRMNVLFAERILPGKTNISLSGCDFSCVRSRTSDIGVIARSEIELTDKKCKQCSLCVKEPLGCQVDAITITDDGVTIDTERCVRCGFCSSVCKPGSIALRSTGYDLYVGGGGGLKPREAVFLANRTSEDKLLDAIQQVLDRYKEQAAPGQRIGDLIDAGGIDVFRT